MKQLSTLFTAYEFTEEELKSAAVLPDLNYKYIQTEAAVAAQKLVTLHQDTDEAAFMREHVYLQGQMDALSALLRMSDDTQTELQRAFAEAAK